MTRRPRPTVRAALATAASTLLAALLGAAVLVAPPAPATAPSAASATVPATVPATVLSAATVPLAGTAGPTVRVAGNALVDGAGRPVQLLGVDRAGTEYACAQGWGVFDGPTDTIAVAAIAGWHVNAVRVPLNESCWLGINGVSPTYGGAAYRDAITAWVGRLHAAGLVAVLDLHWNAPGTVLATSQQDMADADHAPAFWTSVASAFRTDPGVVFDLYNEPHDISWDCWRDGCTTSGGWQAAGMQSLLDAVRATGATQPVIANGDQWGGDLSGWLAHRPVDPAGQLVAGLHEYSFGGCVTTACWDSVLAPVAAAVPVVTGELGEDDCGGTFVEAFMAWADAHGLGYLGWTWNTWDCRTGPALISGWDGTPTAFGAAVQRHLAARAAAAPTSSPAPTASPTASPSPSSSSPSPTAAPTASPSPTVTPSPTRSCRTTRCRLQVLRSGALAPAVRGTWVSWPRRIPLHQRVGRPLRQVGLLQ